MEPIIFCDFDGTISLQDVNDKVCFHFGDEYTYEVEEAFSAGKIGTYESLSTHYNRLKITEKEFFDYIKENIKIDPYFKSFYQGIKEKGIDIAIISGGFLNYINFIFKKYDVEITSQIYASKLIFTNKNIKIDFFHDKEEMSDCHQDFGICGVCKYKIIEKYKGKKAPIIYIGDGLTDRCAAEVADIILAKKGKSLEEYCQQEEIEYKSFSDFKEVNEIIEYYLQ